MIAGLRCNYPKDGPGFFAGSHRDEARRIAANAFNWGLDGITGDRRLIGLAMRNCIAASSPVGR